MAIVDTGIERLHQDFIREGFVGVSSSCFFSPSHSTSCEDNNGHGTHVAGIVAASDNTIDVVGVAPEVTLYSVKVLGIDGRGNDSDVILGLDWVIENANVVGNPIRVVNMSFGRTGTLNDNTELRQRVQTLEAMGISQVAAAGNCAFQEVDQVIPAAYPEVMAVASSTAVDGDSTCNGLTPIPADTAAVFTTDGAFDPGTRIGVVISAPGKRKEDRLNIQGSCFRVTEGILSLKLGGGTERRSGTSMSSPHVAGVVALMWENSGTLLPDTALDTIRSSADRIGIVPLNNTLDACVIGGQVFTDSYTFDGEREGIVSAPGALL